MKTNNSAIDNFLGIIDKAEFGLISYPQVPEPGNQRIVKVLNSFFKDHLYGRSKKHPLVHMAIHYSAIANERLPLMPVLHLKLLGVLLAFIEDRDEDSYQFFKKKLASYKMYNQALFELKVGCILKKNDPDIIFYEVYNPTSVSPPDFYKKVDNGNNIWIEAYVRQRNKYFFEYFENDNKGAPIPKEQEEIENILTDFVKTTCSAISRKRKSHIPHNDIFIAAVQVIDKYSGGSIDYQSLVNSFRNNDVLVVFKGKTAFQVGKNLAKDSIEICFNENNELAEKQISYIQDIFS